MQPQEPSLRTTGWFEWFIEQATMGLKSGELKAANSYQLETRERKNYKLSE
jgi:hypothetical protein